MKLQKNNKYTKKLTAGLGTIIVSLGLLTGCNNNVYPSKDTLSNEITYEDEFKDENKNTLSDNLNDPDYFSKYYNISNDELNNRLNNIDIKYPEKLITLDKVGTLVLKDYNGDYKILQTGEYYDPETSKFVLYDLFTEEVLCKIDASNMDYNIGNFNESRGKYIDIDVNNFYDLSNNLYEYKIVEYGTVQYGIGFIVSHFSEIIDKYAPVRSYYTYDVNNQYDYLIGDEYDKYFKEMSRSIYDLACNYVRNIPYDFQIASKDLNLSSDKIENKYNIYDISEYEKQEKVSKMNIVDVLENINVKDVFTLVVEDSNNEPQIILAYAVSDDDINFKLYDLFSLKYLCDFKVRNINTIQVSKNDRLIDYDDNDFSNKSDLMSNYYIKEIGLYDYSLSYVVENIDYFRNRDNINYQIMSDAYYYVFPNGKKGVSMNIIEYAKNYVTYTPEEMQIYSKNLENSNDKILIKK